MRAVITLVGFMLASVAAAEDHICKDILVNGTKATAEWRSDVFLSQLLEVQSKEISDRQSNNDIQTGASYGIIGGYGNKNDRDRFFTEVNKSVNFQSVFRDKSSALLSSGDATIVEAWKDCMKRAYGLSLRFDTKSADSANLIIEWFAYPTAPDVRKETKVKEDVAIPPYVQISDPNRCLKAGTVLETGQTCTVQVTAPPEREISIVLSTLHGEASAFLPPRLRIVEEKAPIEAVFTEGRRRGKPLEAGSYSYDAYTESGQLCWVAPEGWYLLEGSLTHPIRVRGAMSRSRCKPKDVSVNAGKQVCWKAFNQTNVKGDSWCYVGLAGELVRWKVEPGL